MKEYHKIQTVFKRDKANKGKTLLMGEWSLPEFEYLSNNHWEFTEKIDGTNIRVMWDGNEVRFGGKTDNASIPAKLVNRLRERFNLSLFQRAFPDCAGGVCLYGEGYGAGIQNGGNYRQDQDFVLFDVWVGGWWLKREDVEDVGKKMSIDVVPIIGGGTLHYMIEFAQEKFQSTWGSFVAEGIVARPKVDLFSRSGGRIITKIKAKDFP